MTETIKLTCHEEEEAAFTSAIVQMGYTILDTDWDEDAHAIHYVVQKKWLRIDKEASHERELTV